MLRTKVERDALEITLSRMDAALLAVSVILLGILLSQAGWEVAAVTLLLSVAFGAMISVVQRDSAGVPK